VRKIAGGATTDFIYDLGGSVVAEVVGGVWTKGYIYFGGQLVAQYSDSTTYFVHGDHLGVRRRFLDVIVRQKRAHAHHHMVNAAARELRHFAHRDGRASLRADQHGIVAGLRRRVT
jgi:hypothetical protein